MVYKCDASAIEAEILGSVTFEGKTYEVTSICDYAFSGCNSLTSVTIPKTIRVIGQRAFESNFKVTAVYINDMSAWCNIMFNGIYANPFTMANADLFLNGERVVDLEIPVDIKKVGYAQFYKCKSIKTVSIPNSVISIESYAFYDCDSLENIDIPNSLQSIANNAFSFCSSLKKIAIPNSVITIANEAFEYCKSLANVTMGNSVSSVGLNAFYGCQVDAVYISDLKAWCNIDFKGNDGYPNPLSYGKADLFLNGKKVVNLEIPDGIIKVGQFQFNRCKSIKSVTFPKSVTSIGLAAFSGCDSLLSLNIGGSVSSIGEKAFSRCNSLKDVTIGESIKSIGKEAFARCKSLTSVTMYNTVADIGGNAFEFCPIKEVYINDLNAWCNILFNGLNSNPLYPGKADLIMKGAKVVDLKIPDGLTNIGSWQFAGCKSINTMALPSQLISISSAAFKECSSLISVTIPNQVTSIGASSFAGCSSMKIVVIPESIISIGTEAFKDCKNLETVFCYALVPPALNGVFAGCPIEKATLHVPIGTKGSNSETNVRTYFKAKMEGYSEAKGWMDFGTIIDDLRTSGIEDVAVDQLSADDTVIVYNIQGMRIHVAERADLRRLPAGLYIVNGSKYFVR